MEVQNLEFCKRLSTTVHPESRFGFLVSDRVSTLRMSNDLNFFRSIRRVDQTLGGLKIYARRTME